jgi:hypothetical protein
VYRRRTAAGQVAPTIIRHRRARSRRPLAITFVIALVGAGALVSSSATAQTTPDDLPFQIQSLDGSGNNTANPDWGLAGNDYSRVADARYADGIDEPVTGPNPRTVSNRIFNDTHQNLFSERNVTQWGFAWGQFLDHTFGLRLGRADDDPVGEPLPIPFDPADPLEEFENDLGVIGFERSARSPGTGESTPREQINTISSYIDTSAVYGSDEGRLEWLREGPVNADLSDNGAALMLPGGYLPRADERGDPASAPEMEVDGHLRATPERAAVAGDLRANENLGLTATQTLMAREHNRIVAQLPDSLSDEEKFQLARRVVIAEQQYITFNEFLPAIGVTLPRYTGYDPTVRTDLSNEFATVGYRAHSMIHGEIELETELDRYTPEQLDAFEALGLELAIEGDELEIAIPLNLAFFNPDLLEELELGPMLQGLGLEAQYNNDEQIDNQLRSVLFQIPVPGNEDCLDGPDLPDCFDGVVDLGAIDVARGADHGMPSYNQLREAYGLAPMTSFTDITGEATDEFPPGLGIDDPASLVFTELFDIDGNLIDPADEDAVEGEARRGVRATTTAARLKAIFGEVDNLDAFTGMLSEQHVRGADFGELQLAIWTREFTNLRDGDRFFYGNDPGLTQIRRTYGLDYRRSLADLIADNTDIDRADLNHNVFLVAEAPGDADCHVAYEIAAQLPGAFLAELQITNTSEQTIRGWELDWQFRSGQRVGFGLNAVFDQDGADVTARNAPWNRTIRPGQTVDGVVFLGSWDNATNPAVTHFNLNGARCTSSN